ncbi:MAG: winged helix-turn-helix transcriptional regulator [Nanoarchaeota archaeon]|nr:winged helix-turn-helix transcriptional regulator [Nanoarchaeota archaeon]
MLPGYSFLLEMVDLLGKKWMIPLLSLLYLSGEINFSAIKKQLKITSKTLSTKLRLLSSSGFVERVAIGSQMRYSLSRRGKKLGQVLFSLAQKELDGMV